MTIVSEEEFDTVLKPRTAAAEVRKQYATVKTEFQETLCKTCGTTKLAGTWDLDFASMVHKVGEPFEKFYLGAYAIPNFEIHATLASTARDKDWRQEADFALSYAMGIFLSMIKFQNSYFGLNLDPEIAVCEEDLADIWMRH